MVMRLCIIAFLLALPILLTAQTELIPETDPDLLRQNLFDFFSESLHKGDLPFSYSGSLSTIALTQNHSFRIAMRKVSALGSLRIKDGFAGSAVGLSLHELSPVVRSVRFGNYRAAFGEGIVLQPAQTSDSAILKDPGSPAYFQPLGVSLALSRRALSLSGFLSEQSRSCTLNDSIISYLPKTRSERLSRTTENLMGISLGYVQKSFSLGILGYRQSYEHDFADPELTRCVNALSLAGSIKFTRLELHGETANIAGKQATALALHLDYPRFAQDLGIRLSSDYRQPAYASRLTRLSPLPNSAEYSYSLIYTPQSRIHLKLSTLVYQPYDDFDGRSLLRQIYGLASYKDSLNIASFALTAFDRDIVTEIDAGYATTNPVHLRLETRLRHEIDPALTWDILLRYHLQDKTGYRADSWFWKSQLTYKIDKLSFTGGLRNWQSVNSFLAPDSEPDQQADLEPQYIPAGQDELMLDLSLSYISKRFSLAIKGSVSLLSGEPQALMSLRLSPKAK